MAYPQQSSALDGTPRSFWFVRTVGGRQTVCGTNGYSLLSSVQAAIQRQLAASGPLPSFGGQIRARDIANIATPVYGEGTGESQTAYDVPTPQSTRGWDVVTLRGLYALGQRYHAPRSTLAQIEADARLPAGRTLSPQTVQYAIWIAYLSEATDLNTGNMVYGRGSPTEVAFAASPPTIMPVVGVMPPFPTDGVVDIEPVCTPPSVVVPTESPIVIATSFSPNLLLIAAVLAGAAVGVSIITKKAPRLEQIRGRR